MKHLIQRIKLSDPGGAWNQSDYPALIVSLDVVAVFLFFGVIVFWGIVFVNAAQAVTP